MISFVACWTYKYKMYCRLEGMNEHEIGICYHTKQNVIFMEKVFKYSKIPSMKNYVEIDPVGFEKCIFATYSCYCIVIGIPLPVVYWFVGHV